MMKPGELSRRGCLEVLERSGVGRVALTTPLGPRIIPVNYTLHDGAIIFRTTAYSVVGTYVRDHAIAFEVGAVDVTDGTAVSVLAWGRGEVVDDPAELRGIRRLHDPQPWAGGRRDTYVRLPTRHVTGLRLPTSQHPPPVDREAGANGSRVRLRDGTEAMIWPLLSTDRAALREYYEKLSAESRRTRFLVSVPHLTEAMLDQLVGDVDGVNHVALVLIAFPDEGPEVPAGIARIARYPDDPSTADLGVTVADEWQGKGVATALLAELMRRRPEGVTRIATQVATYNEASLAMLRRLGNTTVELAGPGCYAVVVDLPAAARAKPADQRIDQAQRRSGDKREPTPGNARL